MISKKRSSSSPRRYTLSDVPTLAEGVRAGDRKILARALTLVESQHPEHETLALALLENLADTPSQTRTIAITGPPGAGKSTFIESMGTRAIAEGYRIAVLSIDPSSELTGGSILGDKTRMPELAKSQMAFVRPSPSRGELGGIHHTTYFVKRICEAAGFDYIFIETVGVGQSEITVRHLVDMNIVLVQPGSGDDLQGIKMGLNEWSDFFVVNKADGDQVALAREAKSNILAAAGLTRKSDMKTPVSLHSYIDDALRTSCWSALLERYEQLGAAGVIVQRRKQQLSYWFSVQTRRVFLQTLERDEMLASAKKELSEKLENDKLDFATALANFQKMVFDKYDK